MSYKWNIKSKNTLFKKIYLSQIHGIELQYMGMLGNDSAQRIILAGKEVNHMPYEWTHFCVTQGFGHSILNMNQNVNGFYRISPHFFFIH